MEYLTILACILVSFFVGSAVSAFMVEKNLEQKANANANANANFRTANVINGKFYYIIPEEEYNDEYIKALNYYRNHIKNKKFIVYPMYLSEGDGRVFIGADSVMRAYNVQPRNCIIADRELNNLRGLDQNDFIHLYPSKQGNYQDYSEL